MVMEGYGNAMEFCCAILWEPWVVDLSRSVQTGGDAYSKLVSPLSATASSK